jgi:UDPglucose 6-dehydrogenase
MKAREVQAKNLAEKLVSLSKVHNLPIVILGKAYKPKVSYEDGSSSILVGFYVEQLGGTVHYDLEDPIKGIYLLGHYGEHYDYNFPEGSIVLDPWRSFKSDNIEVIQYGNTRPNG